jgi:hypothetical protein
MQFWIISKEPVFKKETKKVLAEFKKISNRAFKHSIEFYWFSINERGEKHLPLTANFYGIYP